MSKNEIKYYSKLKQKKYRESEGLFLIEGINLIEECLKSPSYRNLLTKVFVRNDFPYTEFLSSVSGSAPHIQVISTDNSGIKALSETVNSQGIIGIVKTNPEFENSHTGKDKSGLMVLLDCINDPGNLGTIIRTCYWYGVDKIYLSNYSVDVYNSKVLRSSQGAVFHVNIESNADAVNITDKLYRDNFEIILTDLKTDEYVSDFKFNAMNNYLLVFGNESNGITGAILENKNYTRLKIRGFSDCESLNIGISAGILLDRIRNC